MATASVSLPPSPAEILSGSGFKPSTPPADALIPDSEVIKYELLMNLYGNGFLEKRRHHRILAAREELEDLNGEYGSSTPDLTKDQPFDYLPTLVLEKAQS